MFRPQSMPLVALPVTLRTETPTAVARAASGETLAPDRCASGCDISVLGPYRLDPPDFASSASCRGDAHMAARLSRPAAHTEIPRVRRIRTLDAKIDWVANAVPTEHPPPTSTIGEKGPRGPDRKTLHDLEEEKDHELCETHRAGPATCFRPRDDGHGLHRLPGH